MTLEVRASVQTAQLQRITMEYVYSHNTTYQILAPGLIMSGKYCKVCM